MFLLLDSLCVEISAILTTVAVGSNVLQMELFLLEKRNLPYVKPIFPYGTMENPLLRKHTFGFWIKENYDQLKALGHKHGGLYNFMSPVYLPINPEFVKNVMQRDFHHFVDRGIYYNERDDSLSAQLFSLGGEKWRNLRTKLTPTFTSGKMKMMFETLVTCSYPMKDAMDEYTKNKQLVDIKEVVARFTADIIGSCAFGLECNSFQSPDADFKKHGKKMVQFGALKFAKITFVFFKPEIGGFFGVTVTPKNTANFFLNVVRDTVNYRKTNKVVRNDMLQLLIELKNNKSPSDVDKHDGKAVTIEEAAA